VSVAWHDSRHALAGKEQGAGVLLKSRYPRRFHMFTGRKLPLTLAFVVLVALAFGASCKGFFVDPVLTTIGVGPTGQNIQKDDTLQMSARGTYDDGSIKNITNSVVWSSSDPSATITKSGLVKAVTPPGTSTISASLDTITGTATVNIVLTGVTAITVDPKTANPKVGDTVPFTCAATVSGQSQQVDITDVATWVTSDTTNTTFDGGNPNILTIDSGATHGEVVTVTVSYTVGTVTFKDTSTVTVQ